MGNTSQNAFIGLGIGFSVIYGLLLFNLPVVRNIEDRVNDSLILLRKSGKQTDDIALINISADKQAFLKPSFYADLSKRLLSERAAVVVLNFPHSWRESKIGGEEDIIELVEKHGDRIVLAVRTIATGQGQTPIVSIYNHFLPFKDVQPAVNIEKIQGFVEYESYSKNSTVPIRPARKITSIDKFRSDDQKTAIKLKSAAYIRQKISTHSIGDQKTEIKLKSAAWLSLEKYYQFLNQKEKLSSSPQSGHINFVGTTGKFNSIDIDKLCFIGTSDKCVITENNQQNFPKFRNKIVLVGITQQHDYLYVAGKQMPATEVQANLINNLMTESLYKIPPNYLQPVIILIGAVIVSQFMISGTTKPGNWHQRWGILPILVVIGGYGSLYLLCFYKGVIFPIALPILIWFATGISLAASLWIAQLLKQDELKQRQLAEKQATVLQTRKLLYRIASDIHDRPLQEIKVVMDRIEIWQFDNPSLNTEPILEKLLSVNRDIRAQLNDIRTIADKLKLTPELRSGLDMGIRSKLKELVRSGELTLKVIDNIQPLEEPDLDSTWIDAREDIFRFFREAVANVIRHAQPPQGNATTVKVSLFQEGGECVLMVENDGSFTNGSATKGHGGGYGTKIMESIAMELTGGKWERSPSANGGMVVKLVWKF
ncbi:MAG: CHASE2 domain-containing protein [Calothrix sp. MO_167.B12]|nr:CHASE2 domain-containing protein [Calothrix sp. MO_167.B12]